MPTGIAPARIARHNTHMLIALADIHARIADRDQVRALMETLQARAREQPGCSYYAFAETVDDPGHFVLVGRWLDQPALDAHYRSDAFADYQANVGQHLVRTSALQVFTAQATMRPFDTSPIDPTED